jgi:hypothetical protein
LVLELELDEGTARVMGDLDRAAAASRDPFIKLFTGAISGVLGNLFNQDQIRARARQPRPGEQQQRQQQQQRRPPPPPPRAPAPDPLQRARELLGFEPTERLTVEKIQKRKQALARVFHPDMAGGSEAQMKRINAAADALLAKLS